MVLFDICKKLPKERRKKNALKKTESSVSYDIKTNRNLINPKKDLIKFFYFERERKKVKEENVSK
mgnify:CR=1 FL=1